MLRKLTKILNMTRIKKLLACTLQNHELIHNLYQVSLSMRMPTCKLRILPDFIIIGAQKAGTTSLYHHLIQHPNIFPALKKELHFFDWNIDKGINWYRAHFAYNSPKLLLELIHNQHYITGEATPHYIFCPQVAMRISEALPHVKLIVLLRDPADRAYSAYKHQVREGVEKLSFEAAIEKDGNRLRAEGKRIFEDKDFNEIHEGSSYLSRGIYIEQIERWMNIFPKTQILIIKSEDYYVDPQSIYERIIKYLNLPDWKLKEYKTYNTGNYNEMNKATRRHLKEFFRPYNQKLYKYLGIDFGWDE